MASRQKKIPLWLAVMGGALLIIGITVGSFWLLAIPFTPSGDQPSTWDLVRLSLTVAAGFGGLVALVVTYRKQQDLEEGRFTEHFGAAAAQLGHPDVAVRIAGVYAMAGTADKTHKQQRQQCIDVLCGYLRLPYQPDIGNNHQTHMIYRKPTRELGAENEFHFQYRQNDREVRQTIVRVIARHLRKEATPSWSPYNFDFTGAHLEEANFDRVLFSGETTSFGSATFSGHTRFCGTTFNNHITWFGNATFSGETTNFYGATFSSGSAAFNGAKFSSDDTNFGYANFSRLTSFLGASFGSGNVSFEHPRRWNPAPFFDWVNGEEDAPKPDNVLPHTWPPVPTMDA